MLFRNCFVIFITFWSFAALAVGPNPSSPSDNGPSSASRVSVSSSPRYQPYPPNPSSRAVQDSRMQPRSQQGESSSSRSQGQNSKVSIPALLSDVGGTSGQGVPVLQPIIRPALSISELVGTASPRPLPPLAVSPRPLSPLAQPSLSPQPDSMSSAALERASPQPLPPLAAPSASSNSDIASSTQQEQNEYDLDFSTSGLASNTVTDRLQELRDALTNPQGRPVRLRLHSQYFSQVENVFATLDAPLTVSFIALEVYQFNKELAFNFEKLLKFLKDISPKLTKLSFIHCDVRLSTRAVDEQYMPIKGTAFLQNIIELKFIRTKIGTTSFNRLGRIIECLKKLEHLTLDFDLEIGQEKPRAQDTVIRLSHAITTIVQHNWARKKNLTLAGDFFDETMMNSFIDEFRELSSKNPANLQKLDLLEAKLSQNQIVNILKIVNQNLQHLNKLKTLYIPDASSINLFNALKTSIQRQRGDLHILSLPSQGQSPSAHPIDILLAVTATARKELARAAREESGRGAPALSSTVSAQPLPPLAAASIASFDSNTENSLQQEQNAVDLDFSNPKLDEKTVKSELQKLRKAAQQGHPVLLRLHPTYFSHSYISFYVNNLLNSSSIAVEFHQFSKWSSDCSFKKVFEFLEGISPKLTKLSFIDCDTSFAVVEKHYSQGQKGTTFLQNITELRFIRTKIESRSFIILARLIKCLKKLEHIALDIEKGKETDTSSILVSKDNERKLSPAIEAIVHHNIHNLDLKKTLTLSGGFFDGTMMGDFIIAAFRRLSSKHKVNLQELDLLEAKLSQNQIVEILHIFNQHPEFLNTLKTLYIPNASSVGQFNELKAELAWNRRDLHISYIRPSSATALVVDPPLAVESMTSSHSADMEEDIEEDIEGDMEENDQEHSDCGHPAASSSPQE